MMVLDSNKIKKLLREKGYTQKEIADEIGISPSTISDWINGNAIPSNLNLQSLAQLLEINPNELMTEQTNGSSINIPIFIPVILPNATINIGLPSTPNQNDEDSNSSKNVPIDSKIIEQITQQAQGNLKEFIEDIIKKHLKL